MQIYDEKKPEEAAATDLRCIFKAAIAREEAVKGRLLNSKSQSKVKVEASFNEKAITAIIAAALTASMVIPEAAEAAGNGVSGVSPSLKNFLLSIVAGAVVLGPILGAIIGVSNFDPVKRN
ncbi:Photosystem II [Olea europaea subsp. europaea]|uniref:Photosystem II n=1 Tax=Olea europaea subsp. europaea TaxID=158383 RepID=A0A8S0V5G9_OLEEU|nr:Photosystem II [Olea europaea subsp. europaea]